MSVTKRPDLSPAGASLPPIAIPDNPAHRDRSSELKQATEESEKEGRDRDRSPLNPKSSSVVYVFAGRGVVIICVVPLLVVRVDLGFPPEQFLVRGVPGLPSSR